MAGDNIVVEVKEREVIGKGLNKLRGEGQVPAVVHSSGKDSLHISGDALNLMKVYLEAGKHTPVHLKIGSKQQLALIKDVDFEPTKRRMRHIVFQALKQNEKVTTEIPLILTGEVPAEKVSLMVITSLDTIQVEALPKDLPDELQVDASSLAEVGDRVHVSDIKAPEGVTILTDPELTIAHVEMPKDQIAEADAAAASLAEDAGVPDEAEAVESSEEAKEAAEEE